MKQNNDDTMFFLWLVLLAFVASLSSGCSCAETVTTQESKDSTWVNYHLVDIPIPVIRERLKLFPLSFVGYTFTSKDSSVAGTVDTVSKEIDLTVKNKTVTTPIAEVHTKTETKQQTVIKEKLSFWFIVEYMAYGAILMFILMTVFLLLTGKFLR